MRHLIFTTVLTFLSISVDAQVMITSPQPEAPYGYLSVVDDEIVFGGEGSSKTERERWVHYRVFSLADTLAAPKEIDLKDPFPGSKELHYLRSVVAFEDYAYEVYFMKGEGRQHHQIIRRNLRTMEAAGEPLDINTDSRIQVFPDKHGVQIVSGPDGNGTGFYRYNLELSEGTGLTYEKLNARDITIHSTELDQYGNLILTGSIVTKRPMYGTVESIEVVIVNDLDGKSHVIVPRADVAFSFSVAKYNYQDGILNAVFYTSDGGAAGFKIASWDEEGQIQSTSSGNFSLEAVMTDELKAALSEAKVKIEKVDKSKISVYGRQIFQTGDKYILCGQYVNIDGKLLENYNLVAAVDKGGNILWQHVIPRLSTNFEQPAEFAVGNNQLKVLTTMKAENVQDGRFISNPVTKQNYVVLYARTIDIADGTDHGFTPLTIGEQKGYKFIEINNRQNDEELEVYKLWNTRANKNRYLIYKW